MKEIKLIPRPQKMYAREGHVDFSSWEKPSACGLSGGTAEYLSGLFGPVTAAESGGFFFRAGRPAAPTVPEKPDAYALSVTAEGLALVAQSAAGLFWGVQTLKQLICGGELCPVEIEDWPAIPIRMIHWDLKGYLPRFEVLCEEFRLLGSYKINAVLLEIEDKYRYACAPEIGVPGAYTHEQMRELSKLAKDLHIAVVPKLQSIAHVDYVLKHDAYRSMREAGHIFQYCPSNEAAQRLWEAMCRELMDCFAEHGPYFHIGADESGYLGLCPDCAKLGKAGSYKKKVGACVDYVLKQGWTPVMWDDIIRNAGHTFSPEEEEELRRELGRKAVLMYWSYGYGGKNNQFPYLDEFRKAGLRVWGASGFSGCDNWAGSVPPLEIRSKNIDAWTKDAVEKDVECICATGWTRIGSADCPAEPQESSWFTSLYAANSMWSGREEDPRAFAEDLFRVFYGTGPEPALLESVLRIGNHPYTADGGADLSRLGFLKVMAALESLETRRTRLLNYFQYYAGKLGSVLEDYRLGLIRGYAQKQKEELEAPKASAEKALAAYYMPVTVEEILRTRFAYLEKLNGELLELALRTKAM